MLESLPVSEGEGPESVVFRRQDGQETGYGWGLGALAHNLVVMESFNTNKLNFLYERLSDEMKTVFDLVPYLIHYSAAGLLPSLEACKKSPRGIFGYEVTPRTIQALENAFPGKKPPSTNGVKPPRVPVQSLTILGDPGTIIQGTSPVLEYRLIYDGRGFNRERMGLFRRKLRLIEIWARKFVGAEISITPLERRRLINNEFPRNTGTDSQPRFPVTLKEEFYRTMTLVAGKAPIWWAMPPGISEQEYQQQIRLIKHSTRIDKTKLLDMGNIPPISRTELIGGLLRELQECVDDKFKLLLKLILLESILSGPDTHYAPCEELKERLWANQVNILLMDHVLLEFDKAGMYLKESERTQDLMLLRKCLYLISGVVLDPGDRSRSDLPRQVQLILNQTIEWGWRLDLVDDLNHYDDWSEREVIELRQEVEDLIAKTYAKVNATLDSDLNLEEKKVLGRDRALFIRKMAAAGSDKNFKIKTKFPLLRRRPVLSQVFLRKESGKEGARKWIVETTDDVEQYFASSLSECLVWLALNPLFRRESEILIKNRDEEKDPMISDGQLSNIVSQMRKFFRVGRRFSNPEDSFFKPPSIARVFLLINPEAPQKTEKVVDAQVCFQNTWGEVFCRGGYADPESGLKAVRDFWNQAKTRHSKNPSSVFTLWKAHPDIEMTIDGKKVVFPQVMRKRPPRKSLITKKGPNRMTGNKKI